MKVAIPTENDILCAHFGHSRQFTIIDVDMSSKTIEKTETLTPPPHDVGVLPAWLADLQCTHIIAGGMGARAVMLFEQSGIQVITGAPQITAQEAVEKFLAKTLTSISNPCQDPEFHEGHECSSHDNE